MLKKGDWYVKDIAFAPAVRLVETHHYAKGTSKQAVALHGLFNMNDEYGVLPYGVCWWIPPPSKSVAKFFSDDWHNVLMLSRLVCTPDAPKNAASFMLSRSVKMLPERYHTLATYADMGQGHTGAIYHATNWQPLGITTPKPIWTDEDGRMVSTRVGQKTLTTSEMLARGYSKDGVSQKYRFRYIRRKASQRLIQLELAM